MFRENPQCSGMFRAWQKLQSRSETKNTPDKALPIHAPLTAHRTIIPTFSPTNAVHQGIVYLVTPVENTATLYSILWELLGGGRGCGGWEGRVRGEEGIVGTFE